MLEFGPPTTSHREGVSCDSASLGANGVAENTGAKARVMSNVYIHIYIYIYSRFVGSWHGLAAFLRPRLICLSQYIFRRGEAWVGGLFEAPFDLSRLGLP